MADPLNPVETYAAAGLAWAVEKMKRSIRIGAVTYYGVRTELSVEVGAAEFGGKKYKKAFSFCIQRVSVATQEAFDALGDTTQVKDDLGATWVVADTLKDAIQVTLTCVGKWA